MILQERLEAIRATAKTRIPVEAQAVMQQSVEAVRASGIMDRVVKVGQPAPEFTLPDPNGQPVSLTQLRARGPVVLSFYRGRW